MTRHYNFDDPDRERKFAELLATENPTGLEQEIAAARLLGAEALNGGKPEFALQCFKTVQALSASAETAKFKRGDLLCKAALLNIAGQIGQLLSNAVENKFEGWEEAIDMVRQQMLTVVVEAQNPDPEKLSQ